MNKLGKFILTLTSLAPILGAMSMHSFATKSYWNAAGYLVLGGILVLLCLALLRRCKRISIQPFKTSKVKTADKEVLAFLVVYLLPIFTKDIFFSGELLTPIYVVLVIGTCVFNSNAFTFNPVLSALQYHFYEIESQSGITYLLITKDVLRRNDNDLEVREISDYIFLQIK
jgi:hypothetical protein